MEVVINNITIHLEREVALKLLKIMEEEWNRKRVSKEGTDKDMNSLYILLENSL